MNKKNFPIFISVLIVSLFFTVVFYYARVNLDANYKMVRANNFADAYINDSLSKEEVEKIREIDGVKEVGRINPEVQSGKLDNDLLAIYRQDKNINKMREISFIEEGHFPENQKEIMLSKALVEKYKIKIGDEICIEFGKRSSEGNELNPTNSRIENEDFEKTGENYYKLVGIYEDMYNKYAGLSYGLLYDISEEPLPLAITFDDFTDVYLNKNIFEDEIENRLGRDINLEFNEGVAKYYRVDESFLEKIMAKAVMIFAVILMILIFIFFIRNIFWVWSLRKIKELSVYKSIGSTDFQIYKLLFKEASLISIVPMLVGHTLGFFLIYGIYRYAQDNLTISKFEYVSFNPLLSGIILLVSFLVIMLAIVKPARKISKINIIDGIRGNIDLSRSKKKTNKDIWKELRLNNLSSIKSQRYISAIGILIISMFVLSISVSRYFRDYYNVDDSYNINAYYYSSSDKVPDVLRSIEKEIDNEKSYIYKDKYLGISNNLDFSDEAKAAKVDQKLKDYLDKNSKEFLDGQLSALDLDDLEKLGGNKGDFVLYNVVQKDPLEPIDKAKRIKYFNDPKTMDISIGDFNKTIDISKVIYDTGEFDVKPYPFVVNIFTDYDTYFKLMEESNDETFLNYPYTLKMKIKDSDVSNAKEFMENKLRESLDINERFDVLVGDEIKEEESSSLKYLVLISLAVGLIIFILNVTNGYSSINISLISRKKEIGSLYSAGMDMDELKANYEKEFIMEEVKSFALVGFITFAVIVIISYLSANLNMAILLKYYDLKIFLGFSLLIYGINYLIYHISLGKILDRPTIDLIKTIE